MRKDNFDNFYITKYVRAIDAKRKILNLTSILPLRNYEKKIYYQSVSDIFFTNPQRMSILQLI